MTQQPLDPAGISAAEEIAEIEGLDGADSGLVADAMRHYADTAPLEHADALSEYLVAESPIDSLDEVELYQEDHPVDDLEQFIDDSSFESDVLSPTEGLEDALDHDDHDGAEEFDDPDFESYDATDDASNGHEIDLGHEGLDSHDGLDGQEGAYETADDDSFADDSYDVDIEDDAPDFDPGDIDFE